MRPRSVILRARPAPESERDHRAGEMADQTGTTSGHCRDYEIASRLPRGGFDASFDFNSAEATLEGTIICNRGLMSNVLDAN